MTGRPGAGWCHVCRSPVPYGRLRYVTGRRKRRVQVCTDCYDRRRQLRVLP